MSNKLKLNPGEKYNFLTIIREAEPVLKTNGTIKFRNFLFKCDCGNEKIINLQHVKTNNTLSCGCYNKKQMSFLGKERKKHGYSREAIYQNWADIKQRCYNQKNKYYNDYGGRGITMCDRWLNSVEDFIKDMGIKPTPQHSVDRINNDGNYEPSNCKWSTKKEQRANQRPRTKTIKT